ncbi:MAG: gluconate 2-dehydrogenase subunit 3 family protein [Planctomycetota bacterium]|nr:gluconate 2-dehydrogenase subunit 3 family protein [Planctomycetota bacterium]
MSDPHSDAPPPPAPEAPQGLSRRRFLTDAAAGAGVATVAWFGFESLGTPAYADDFLPTQPGEAPKTFTAREWHTLAAACDRLLPSSPGSPGARDVNAIGYLDAVLQQDFIQDSTRTTVKDGAGKLEARSQRRWKKSFKDLAPAEQDEAIRVFETFKTPDGRYPGHTWLKWMLQFILEAFFGDPVHGGNPNEIGWKWAGHKPGFPRPEEPGWRPKERLG